MPSRGYGPRFDWAFKDHADANVSKLVIDSKFGGLKHRDIEKPIEPLKCTNTRNQARTRCRVGDIRSQRQVLALYAPPVVDCVLQASAGGPRNPQLITTGSGNRSQARGA